MLQNLVRLAQSKAKQKKEGHHVKESLHRHRITRSDGNIRN